MNITNYILFTCLAIGLTGCLDDRFEDNIASGEYEGQVKLILSVDPVIMEGNTRVVDEGSNEHSSIKDVWLIETDSNGKVKNDPQYFEGDDMTTLTANLVLPDGDNYYWLRGIANTHNPELGEELSKCTTNIELNNLKYLFEFPASDLIMNGAIKIDSRQSYMKFSFSRNVAKLDITVTVLECSGVELKSSRLRSIPVSSRYLDIQNGTAETEVFDDEAFNFEDSDIEICTYGPDNKPAKKITKTYYLPRNMKGSVECNYEYRKNGVAPKGATFIEFYGVTQDNTPVKYTFYPGKNMTNNFDIHPNHAYKLDIVIDGKGNPILDDRVTSYDLKELPDANSHIINWNPAYGTTQRLYSFEIDRINRFWETVATTDNDKYLLRDGDEWVAEVVWQDSPEDLFYFCDDSGMKKESCSHSLEGTWPECSIRLRPTGAGVGNVLVGVRKKNHDPDTDGYMWSWHLWITDYDPDYRGSVNDIDYFYPVDGGHVHRYLTGTWKTNLPATKGCIIMDRNFGAKRADASSELEKIDCSGMFYYFGRKDPFPDYNAILYRWIHEEDKDGLSFTEKLVSDSGLAVSDKFINLKSATSCLRAIPTTSKASSGRHDVSFGDFHAVGPVQGYNCPFPHLTGVMSVHPRRKVVSRSRA